ncbi:hypothetical protein KDH83_12925 [Achromobacter sp. Marseille-Q0513]|uniref:phage neck terminator protein n=1 Tax=Achromobacter sp. Marseille-Q0513 TaxID=2829161 RepID=UPI001B9D91D5|nr:hypothetical protein [Achromobacter sp. Marseille-Q0513]MBR8654197.1 hypothetical protein [Achromobacter sp. Marseille-Q0513]
MTDKELYLLLRPGVSAASGVPLVIMAVQNAPAPKGAYASIHVRTNIDQRGMAFNDRELLPDKETFRRIVRSQQEVTCTVEFYRQGAKRYAANLLQMDKREDIIWKLFKAGLSIMRTGPVLDLTALQSDQYEERARVEIVLRMEVSNAYGINRIMEVTGTVQNENGAPLQSATVKA